jgi:hypothetical protein
LEVDFTHSVAIALSGQALHAEDAAAGFDADVEGGGFSPGLGDFVAVEHGLGHEKEFGPLAALFESFENFEFVHWWLRRRAGVREAAAPNRKGATRRPRLLAGFFTLYIQNSILRGVKWPKFFIFYLEWSEGVRGK